MNYPNLCESNPTNSSQSDTLQVKSPFLEKQTDGCYFLGFPKTRSISLSDFYFEVFYISV